MGHFYFTVMKMMVFLWREDPDSITSSLNVCLIRTWYPSLTKIKSTDTAGRETRAGALRGQ